MKNLRQAQGQYEEEQKLKSLRQNALQQQAAQKAITSEGESAMNAHSLAMKKQSDAAQGLDFNKTKLEGVDPSKAEAVSGGLSMDKAAAAASIAQKMGLAPSGGTAGGVISGAASGAAFGPAGAAIGAVAGGVMGAASAAAARKAHNAQVEARKERELGQIEQNRGQNISNALASMGARMRIR